MPHWGLLGSDVPGVHFKLVAHCPVCSGHQLLVRIVSGPPLGDDFLPLDGTDVARSIMRERNAERLLGRPSSVGEVRNGDGVAPLHHEGWTAPFERAKDREVYGGGRALRLVLPDKCSSH